MTIFNGNPASENSGFENYLYELQSALEENAFNEASAGTAI